MKQLFTLLLFTGLFTNALAQAGGEDCSSATVIPSIPFVGSGSTSAATNDYEETCPDVVNQGGAKDVIYKYTTGNSVEYITLSLCIAGTNYDSQLYVYQGTCQSGTAYACQEDGCQSPAYNNAYNSEIINLMLLANTDYYIVIDGYGAGSMGNYQLNADPGVAPPTTQIPFGDSTTLLPTSTVSARSGSPMAISDMNNDGLDDIIRLHNSQTLLISYQQPNGTFTELSLGNVAPFYKVWAICVTDVDTNGYNDIAIGDYNDVKIFMADATGSSYTSQSINTSPIFAQGMNFVDINNDGGVELFVCNDVGESHLYQFSGTSWSRNTTAIDFTTTPVSDKSGNYGSLFTDLDNDGDLDLYITKCRQGVTNTSDGRRINQWIENTGSGMWSENTSTILRDSAQSWVTDFGDIDNDGDLDAFVMNHDQVSRFYRNTGNGVFEELTTFAGLTQTSFAGIQTYFRDFNNDGYLDLLATGSEHRLWINNGDTTFTLDIDPFGVVNDWILSAVVGDLNHDGFLDLYTSYGSIYNTASGSAIDRLWLNNGANGNHFLQLNLEGVVSNYNGIGARIEAYGPWGIQVREVRAGEGYGTQNTFTQHFGLGTETVVDSIVVKWPSGMVDYLYDVQADQWLDVVEGSFPAPQVVLSNGQSSSVTDSSATIGVQMLLREDFDTDVLFTYWPEGGAPTGGNGGTFNLAGGGQQVFQSSLDLNNLFADTTYHWTVQATFDATGQNLVFTFDTLSFNTLSTQLDSNAVVFSNEQTTSITDSSATLEVDMELRQDFNTDVTFTYWPEGGAAQSMSGGTYNPGGSGTQVFNLTASLNGLMDDTTYHWTVEAALDPAGNNMLFTHDTVSFQTLPAPIDSAAVELRNFSGMNFGWSTALVSVDTRIRKDGPVKLEAYYWPVLEPGQLLVDSLATYDLQGGAPATFASTDTLYTWGQGEYDFAIKATYLPMSTADEFWTDTVRLFITGSVNEFAADLLKIYPNPTSGTLMIETTPELERLYPSYKLYDAQACVISEIAEPKSNERLQIDAPAGIYFLKVSTREGSGRTYRIAKQ